MAVNPNQATIQISDRIRRTVPLNNTYTVSFSVDDEPIMIRPVNNFRPTPAQTKMLIKKFFAIFKSYDMEENQLSLNIAFTPKIRQRGRPRLFFTPEMFNCVVYGFRRALLRKFNKNGKPDRRAQTAIKNLNKYHDKNELKKNGASFNTIKEIVKISKLNCIVLDGSRNEIFKYSPHKKTKTVILVSDGDHVKYVPQMINCESSLCSVFSPQNQLPPEERIRYTLNDIRHEFDKDDSLFKFCIPGPNGISDMTSYFTLDTNIKHPREAFNAYVVKNEHEFPAEDMEPPPGYVKPEHPRDYYKFQTNNASCITKDLIEKYDLKQNMKSSARWLKEANMYMPAIQYVKNQNMMPYEGFDVNRSFSAYSQSPYYSDNKFAISKGLMRVPPNYTLSDLNSYLNHSGFGIIKNVNLNHCTSWVIKDLLQLTLPKIISKIPLMELKRYLHY